tara:strand:- start:371 stop:769 length:399 start_codon:yes stop_codon:yes gene_type:complete
MKNFLIFLAAASLGGFFMPAHGQGLKPPPDMYQQTVPFSLWCVPSFARMIEILAEDFSEAPVLISQMSPTSTLIVFRDQSSSTSTFVASRLKNDGTEEVCVIWSGSSDAMSFSLNPSPVFPEGQRKKDGVDL